MLTPCLPQRHFAGGYATRERMCQLGVEDTGRMSSASLWQVVRISGTVAHMDPEVPASAYGEIEDLIALLSERTKLVCFTHCSNLVRRVHDVEAIARIVH